MHEATLKAVRKTMKISDASPINPKRMVIAYLKPETEEPVFVKETYFQRLELDEQEMLMKTFKKVTTGALNKKIYELSFSESHNGHTQDALESMLDSGAMTDFAVESQVLIQKILDNYTYESDVVFQILEMEIPNGDQTWSFIVCSINKVEKPKGIFVFDPAGIDTGDGENEFTTKYSTDPVVNLSSPLEGFLYPSVEDGGLNVNKVLYYNKKANAISPLFVSEVLNAEVVLTASQEKTYFNDIMKSAVGSLTAQTLYNVYDSIQQIFIAEDDSENRRLHRGQLDRVLHAHIPDFDKDLQEVYEEIMGIQNYGFSVDNILPEFGKPSLTLKSDYADVKIDPKKLRNIKQVESEDGKMFLMIEIHNDSTADGIGLVSDKISTIEFEEQ